LKDPPTWWLANWALLRMKKLTSIPEVSWKSPLIESPELRVVEISSASPG